MRRTILALALLLFAFEAVAQTTTSQKREEPKLLTTIYYEFNQIQVASEELTKLDAVIELLNSDASAKVQIEGYGDAIGGEAANERVSLSRAERVANYLLKHNVAKSQISFVGCGIDTSAESNAKARRVDVSQIITVVIEPKKEEVKPIEKPQEVEDARAAEPIEDIDTEMQVEPEPKQEPIPVAATTADGFSLRTNLLYLLTGNINLGAEYKKNSFGYLINGGYSPFEKTEWNHNLGSWFVAPEIRYYLGEKEAWFVGAQFLAGGYNYKLSDTGYTGSMIGGGVTGGYKLTLSESFDMDFSLGLGYGTLNYDTYYKHNNGTNVYIDKDITKNTFMPVQLGVSLIFKL